MFTDVGAVSYTHLDVYKRQPPLKGTDVMITDNGKNHDKEEEDNEEK